MDFRKIWFNSLWAAPLHSALWIMIAATALIVCNATGASDDVMWTVVVTAMLGYSTLSAVGGWFAPSWLRHTGFGALGYILLTLTTGWLCGALSERGFADVQENRGVYDGLVFSYFMITGVGGIVRMIASFLDLEGTS